MRFSKLEKLWEGTQLLTNLKKMDLSESWQLKELPNLSNATSLEKLALDGCESLVEIPSSCSHLHKLQSWTMSYCIKLENIPAHLNLASLEDVNMRGCSKLRNFQVMSTNIKQLCITKTAVEDVPSSIKLCSRLEHLDISCNGNLKGLTHLPASLTILDLSYSDIERIPDCIKAFYWLRELKMFGCRRLASLPELPCKLRMLMAEDCESLETLFCPLNIPNAEVNFTNCLKLNERARRDIIQQSIVRGRALLPGRELPAEFDHRGQGNTLTIRQDGFPDRAFVVCVVISSKKKEFSFPQLLCRRIGVGQGQDDFYGPVEMLVYAGEVYKFRKEHLFIIDSYFLGLYPFDMSRETVLELSSKSNDFDIIECGAKILTKAHEL